MRRAIPFLLVGRESAGLDLYGTKRAGSPRRFQAEALSGDERRSKPLDPEAVQSTDALMILRYRSIARSMAGVSGGRFKHRLGEGALFFDRERDDLGPLDRAVRLVLGRKAHL
jgi:hypothetical protein